MTNSEPEKIEAGKFLQIPASIIDQRTGKASWADTEKSKPILVAIVGGSGSGKTWLTNKLLRALASRAIRLSLDDFYHDRSHLPPARRAQLNFDHPRAIDWMAVEGVLKRLVAGKPARVPRYNFSTHSRMRLFETLKPRHIILMEGLWLMHRPVIRQLTSVSLFLHCPTATRLSRRLARDIVSRGRTRSSVRKQFELTVEPMHRRYVAPQTKWVDFVFPKNPGIREIRWLVNWLRKL